jgi:hypothetical protein
MTAGRHLEDLADMFAAGPEPDSERPVDSVPIPDPIIRSLPVTQWAVATVLPHDWLHVADFLSGILARAPLREAPGWDAERIVLGALASELRANAVEAGEPVELREETLLWIETQRWPNERLAIAPSGRLHDADIAAAATRT